MRACARDLCLANPTLSTSPDTTPLPPAQELKQRGVEEQHIRAALEEVFGPGGKMQQQQEYESDDDEGSSAEGARQEESECPDEVAGCARRFLNGAAGDVCRACSPGGLQPDDGHRVICASVETLRCATPPTGWPLSIGAWEQLVDQARRCASACNCCITRTLTCFWSCPVLLRRSIIHTGAVHCLKTARAFTQLCTGAWSCRKGRTSKSASRWPGFAGSWVHAVLPRDSVHHTLMARCRRPQWAVTDPASPSCGMPYRSLLFLGQSWQDGFSTVATGA